MIPFHAIRFGGRRISNRQATDAKQLPFVRHRGTFAWAALSMTLAGAVQSGHAASAEAVLQPGAYVGPGTTCEETFVTKTGRLAYREPRNAFSAAMIVNDRLLTTPSATCRLNRQTRTGDTIDLDLSCANGVAWDKVRAIVQLKPDGGFVRLIRPGDSSGEPFTRCVP